MNLTEKEIELMAYRFIRIEARRFDRDTSDSEFANYVKGIVDMQTEIYAKLSEPKENKQSRCNNCQNNTDELSGECYECVKGMEDWYEPISELKGDQRP